MENTINSMLNAYYRANYTNKLLHSNILEVRKKFLILEQKINGSKVKSEIGEPNEYPRIKNYLWAASGSSSYGPTETHKKSLINADKLFNEVYSEFNTINQEIKLLIIELEKIGAPQIRSN